MSTDRPESPGPTRPWWAGGVGYEVYLRSFADADGDGVGDLRGLLDRLDHLAWLGVTIVWVTPFYPSPLHDHGYDVADYTGVAPEYGTLTDFDSVVEKAHRLGMRVMIDIVPNHSSSEHPWFREARSSRDNPYREYYHWRDGGPDGALPNNWPGHFGGPAWTYDEATGQYWLHQFTPEQPDLNWHHPPVAGEFDRILTFWLERGVDGFRIDVAHSVVKHPDLPDLPLADEPDEGEGSATAGPEDGDQGEAGVLSREFERFEHLYDANQPEVLDVYRRWRKVVEPHDGLLLGEVYVLDAETLAPYVASQDGLHLTFWFSTVHARWDASAIRRVLVAGAGLREGTVAWVAGSHDRSRVASRFGGGELGRLRGLAFATLLMGMPGVPFVYQGEELGLLDGVIPAEQAQDPMAARGGELDRNRDVCRTPMPWSPGPGFGFTDADEPWLPFGGRANADTVAVQREDPASFLHRYRRLVGLRRSLSDLHSASLTWLTDDGPIVAYRRGDVIVAANCGEATAGLELPPGTWRIAFDSTGSSEDAGAAGEQSLAPAQAVVLTPA